MTVKDILRHAILFCGRVELLTLNSFVEGSETAPTVDQQADIDLFVQCFNFVYKEIASGYFDLLEKEEVEFDDGEVLYTSLSKTLINVKKVTAGGRAQKYFLYPDHIECDVKKATIVYSYLPDDLGIGDEVNMFSGRVLAQVIAWGVAREYSLIVGNHADADVWEARFKGGLRLAHSKRKASKLPERRFV